MNPISEEDEDESLNLSLSFRSETFNRVKIISEESNFEPYDEHIVSNENSYTPVLKQWLEYKTESSINSSIFPHITSSSIEMFPMIVRGLDLEQTHLKYGNGKDSEDLLSVKLVRKNGLTRGNTFTAVSDTLLNEFRSPKREDLLAEDLESNISNSFSHDSISILLPRSPNGKEIQLKRALQEDELLTLNEKIGLLIGKNIIIDTTEKKGFWEKLGFSNKKKDDEIFYLMLGSMKSTQKLYLNAQAKTEETRNKATNLQDQIINFKLENDTLQDCIAGLRRKITQEKISSHTKLEKKRRELEEATNTSNQILSNLDETERYYLDRLYEDNEREERWRMRIEDIRLQLDDTILQKEIAYSKVAEYSDILNSIQKEQEFHVRMNQQMQLGMKLYTEACEYFNLAEEGSNEIGDIKAVLSEIRDSAYASLYAYKEFVSQATTDPKEKLPYSRSAPKLSSLKLN